MARDERLDAEVARCRHCDGPVFEFRDYPGRWYHRNDSPVAGAFEQTCPDGLAVAEPKEVPHA